MFLENLISLNLFYHILNVYKTIYDMCKHIWNAKITRLMEKGTNNFSCIRKAIRWVVIIIEEYRLTQLIKYFLKYYYDDWNHWLNRLYRKLPAWFPERKVNNGLAHNYRTTNEKEVQVQTKCMANVCGFQKIMRQYLLGTLSLMFNYKLLFKYKYLIHLHKYL